MHNVFHKWVYLSLLIAQSGFSSSRPLDNAFEVIDESHPFARYVGGGFSLFFGTLAFVRGTIVLADGETPTEEDLLGGGLVALGAIRIVDGASEFFTLSKSEVLSSQYRGDSSKQKAYWIEQLEQQALSARKIRYARAGLIGVTAALYLTLYSTQKEKYELLLYPGLALTGVTLFRLFSKSPAESAWETYLETGGIALNDEKIALGIMALPKQWQFQMVWRF